MKKVIGTIMYFWGSIVPAKNMYIPKTLGVITFTVLLVAAIYYVIKYFS
jgi:hypothetical protein|tara:strand:- start:1050 stop:1196 length:147 start_codon:yes stop_codon:yes gene_type:complete